MEAEARQRLLFDAVVAGEAERATAAVRSALESGTGPLELVSTAIAPAMAEVGRLFEDGEYFVPELLMAARATKQAFELLRPLLARHGIAPVGRVLLGTVRGDMHDIGKNLVGAMLEGGGFEVVDLGVDVPPEEFVVQVERQQPEIVGLSALLTTTVPAMESTLQALAAGGLRARVKVMVGGAPLTQALADKLGADGYADSAVGAVAVARRLAGH